MRTGLEQKPTKTTKKGSPSFPSFPSVKSHHPEELDFIINYDIKYRLGRSTEEVEE